jgi:HAE1 family hydrophobic/amphiphilic exporter-1
VNLSDVYLTMQAFMGGAFVNYFNRFGRQWQVYVQADGEYRTNAEDIGEFYVTNADGGRVPLSAVARVEPQSGPEFTMRYNGYRSAVIIGAAAPGYSSDQAMRALEEAFTQSMPSDMSFTYTGMSYQEQLAAQGVSATTVFALSLLVVFLILAALYESWTLPLSVLLPLPIGVFGAFLALSVRGLENAVYAQIGLVMIVGLSAKNAILIVEYAKTEYEQGRRLEDAALDAARIRLRPILMTSFAFILGTLPLALASGAASAARRVLGTTVIGGMLAATLLAIFVIPAIFWLVERLTSRRHPRAPQAVPVPNASGDAT